MMKFPEPGNKPSGPDKSGIGKPELAIPTANPNLENIGNLLLDEQSPRRALAFKNGFEIGVIRAVKS